VFALMALIFFGPLYEAFDHLDKFTQGGDDTVLTVIGLLTYTGFVLCICPFVLGLFLEEHKSDAVAKCILGGSQISPLQLSANESPPSFRNLLPLRL